MRLGFRFVWVTLLTACAAALFVRFACDEPPHGPPALARGLVVWGVAGLVAALDFARTRRRLRSG